MDLLARREHSHRELTRKLLSKGFEPEPLQQALADLQADGLLSDARFAEAYLGMRVAKGYGPQRIRMELQERGVDEALISECLAATQQDWFAAANAVRRKRFGATLPADFKERAKQARFLQYRGFSTEQVKTALEDDGWD